MLRTPHAAGNLGDAIPRRLQRAGFHCDVVGTQRVRLIGRLTFFRAVRLG